MHTRSLFMLGLIAGGVSAIVSLVLACVVINKNTNENNTVNRVRLNNIIDRVRNILIGTNSECMIDIYLEIIVNSYNLFENDNIKILDNLEKILNSGKDRDVIIKLLEDHISALDIIHECQSTVYTNSPSCFG